MKATTNTFIKIGLITLSVIFSILAIGCYIIELTNISSFINLGNEVITISIFNTNSILTLIISIFLLIFSLFLIISVGIFIFQKKDRNWIFVVLFSYIILIAVLYIIFKFISETSYNLIDLSLIENKDETIINDAINSLNFEYFCTYLIFILISMMFSVLTYFVINVNNLTSKSSDNEISDNDELNLDENNAYALKRKELEQDLKEKQELLKIVELQNQINELESKIDLKPKIK